MRSPPWRVGESGKTGARVEGVVAQPSKAGMFGESTFVVEEGFLYRAARTGAIWMNKLFFGAVILWAVWVLLAYGRGVEACAGEVETTCNPLLTQTSLYLGAMAIASFLLSLAFGGLGLLVGKRVLERTAAADEVGARRPDGGDGPGKSP